MADHLLFQRQDFDQAYFEALSSAAFTVYRSMEDQSSSSQNELRNSLSRILDTIHELLNEVADQIVFKNLKYTEKAILKLLGKGFEACSDLHLPIKNIPELLSHLSCIMEFLGSGNYDIGTRVASFMVYLHHLYNNDWCFVGLPDLEDDQISAVVKLAFIRGFLINKSKLCNFSRLEECPGFHLASSFGHNLDRKTLSNEESAYGIYQRFANLIVRSASGESSPGLRHYAIQTSQTITWYLLKNTDILLKQKKELVNMIFEIVSLNFRHHVPYVRNAAKHYFERFVEQEASKSLHDADNYLEFFLDHLEQFSLTESKQRFFYVAILLEKKPEFLSRLASHSLIRDVCLDFALSGILRGSSTRVLNNFLHRTTLPQDVEDCLFKNLLVVLSMNLGASVLLPMFLDSKTNLEFVARFLRHLITASGGNLEGNLPEIMISRILQKRKFAKFSVAESLEVPKIDGTNIEIPRRIFVRGLASLDSRVVLQSLSVLVLQVNVKNRTSIVLAFDSLLQFMELRRRIEDAQYFPAFQLVFREFCSLLPNIFSFHRLGIPKLESETELICYCDENSINENPIFKKINQLIEFLLFEISVDEPPDRIELGLSLLKELISFGAPKHARRPASSFHDAAQKVRLGLFRIELRNSIRKFTEIGWQRVRQVAIDILEYLPENFFHVCHIFGKLSPKLSISEERLQESLLSQVVSFKKMTKDKDLRTAICGAINLGFIFRHVYFAENKNLSNGPSEFCLSPSQFSEIILEEKSEEIEFLEKRILAILNSLMRRVSLFVECHRGTFKADTDFNSLHSDILILKELLRQFPCQHYTNYYEIEFQNIRKFCNSLSQVLYEVSALSFEHILRSDEASLCSFGLQDDSGIPQPENHCRGMMVDCRGHLVATDSQEPFAESIETFWHCIRSSSSLILDIILFGAPCSKGSNSCPETSKAGKTYSRRLFDRDNCERIGRQCLLSLLYSRHPDVVSKLQASLGALTKLCKQFSEERIESESEKDSDLVPDILLKKLCSLLTEKDDVSVSTENHDDKTLWRIPTHLRKSLPLGAAFVALLSSTDRGIPTKTEQYVANTLKEICYSGKDAMKVHAINIISMLARNNHTCARLFGSFDPIFKLSVDFLANSNWNVYTAATRLMSLSWEKIGSFDERNLEATKKFMMHEEKQDEFLLADSALRFLSYDYQSPKGKSGGLKEATYHLSRVRYSSGMSFEDLNKKIPDLHKQLMYLTSQRTSGNDFTGSIILLLCCLSKIVFGPAELSDFSMNIDPSSNLDLNIKEISKCLVPLLFDSKFAIRSAVSRVISNIFLDTKFSGLGKDSTFEALVLEMKDCKSQNSYNGYLLFLNEVFGAIRSISPKSIDPFLSFLKFLVEEIDRISCRANLSLLCQLISRLISRSARKNLISEESMSIQYDNTMKHCRDILIKILASTNHHTIRNQPLVNLLVAIPYLSLNGKLYESENFLEFSQILKHEFSAFARAQRKILSKVNCQHSDVLWRERIHKIFVSKIYDGNEEQKISSLKALNEMIVSQTMSFDEITQTSILALLLQEKLCKLLSFWLVGLFRHLK
eukprot:GHVP01048774.1.p1 GENE.GHVP01048774.1~~GHVP01048774.1.p1  ORF type:complete len:1593 (-),score=296.03 GHVP01048774.1:2352-7043(-)